MDERLLKVSSKEEDGGDLRNRVWVESKKVWSIATPGSIARLSIVGLVVLTQTYMGHFSAIDLATYTLAQLLNVKFACGILMGMSSATETLCGQAYGAGQKHMMGIYLQKSWIINLITTTILLPIFIFATPIFKLLGIEKSLSEEAQKFSIWFIPVIYCTMFILTLQMYLQAQLKNKIIAWFSASSFLAHLMMSWLFVTRLNLGIPGAMSSLIMSNLLIVIGKIMYVFGGWCPDTWKGFTKTAFYDLWPMVKISISSGLMVCLEIWYTSILILVSGHMKNATVDIAAFSICLNINSMQLMVCFGFFGAAIVRVSNELGKGNTEAAKFAIKVVLVTSVTLGVFVCVLYLIFSREIAYIFTSDEEVVDVVNELSVLLAISMFFNSIFTVLTGVAIGAGLQNRVAIINLVCYYVIGVPFGALLAYRAGLKVQGLWIGMLSGVVVQVAILGFIIWKTDWDEQVNKATDRLNRWFVKLSEDTNESQNCA